MLSPAGRHPGSQKGGGLCGVWKRSFDRERGCDVLSGAREVGGGRRQEFVQQRERDKPDWCPDDMGILVRRDRKQMRDREAHFQQRQSDREAGQRVERPEGWGRHAAQGMGWEG